jgi:hypothetical protein
MEPTLAETADENVLNADVPIDLVPLSSSIVATQLTVPDVVKVTLVCPADAMWYTAIPGPPAEVTKSRVQPVIVTVAPVSYPRKIKAVAPEACRAWGKEIVNEVPLLNCDVDCWTIVKGKDAPPPDVAAV